MDKNEITHEIKKHLWDLEVKYSYTPDNDLTSALNYLKYSENRILEIGMGILKLGNQYGLLIGGGAVVFLEVENIVTPILVKNEIIGEVVMRKFHSTFSERGLYQIIGGRNISNDYFIIQNTEDVKNFCDLFLSDFNNYVEPFFNRWRDIRDLLPLIENITPKMAFNLLGSGAVFKRLTIWKLCNHPEYEKRIKERIEQFLESKKNNPGEIQFERFLNSAIQLSEVLSKTEPLYEWDPEYLKLK